MFPCVVELQSMLVEPHDELDFPSGGIALPRLGGSQVRVADEDDRPEAPAFLLVVPGIVVSVLSPVPKIVALLLHGSDGIAEGIEEPAVGKRMLLILDVPPSVRENAFERKHGMVSDHEGASLQRRKVVEVAVFLQAVLDGGYREALVRHDDSAGNPASVDEIGVCRGIQHVAGIAERTDRLALLQVEGVEYGDVVPVPQPGLVGVVRKGVDRGVVALQRPVDQKMVVYPHLFRSLPHERVDHGKLLSDVGEKLGNGVPGQRYAGMEFGEEGILIFLLQLAVLHVGVACPEHRHRIELHGILMGIHFLNLGDHVGEEILAQPCIRPVKKRGRQRRGVLLCDGNILSVDDVADGRTVYGYVPAVNVTASDPLLDSVVSCGCDIDHSVRRPFYGQDFLRNGHVRSPLLYSLLYHTIAYMPRKFSAFFGGGAGQKSSFSAVFRSFSDAKKGIGRPDSQKTQ